MWSEKKKKLDSSSVSQLSPSKSSYKFRPPLPLSTPSPRGKASPTTHTSKTITYKRLLNTILNLELQKHIEKLRRLTVLFRNYDEDQDGAISLSNFINILNEVEIDVDAELLLTASHYIQEIRLARK
jgi:hypothetical protein